MAPRSPDKLEEREHPHVSHNPLDEPPHGVARNARRHIVSSDIIRRERVAAHRRNMLARVADIKRAVALTCRMPVSAVLYGLFATAVHRTRSGPIEVDSLWIWRI